MRYGLLNDIRILKRQSNSLMVEKFAALSVQKENYSFDNIILPLSLVRISLKDLGFTGPTELDKVYEKSKLENLSLVEPSIALLCREFYLEQSTGEWLRFATPFESMIDPDGVPHLPKLGKALNLYFVETYWSYPKAIFHPHNEFVVCKYDI